MRPYGERRLAHDQPVLERSPGRLGSGVHGEADRAELHLDDRLKAIAPAWRRGQPGDEARLHLGQHSLERNCGDVVALIDDHLAVGRDDVVDALLADEALDHRHVQPTVGLRLPAPIWPIAFGSRPRNMDSWAIH